MSAVDNDITIEVRTLSRSTIKFVANAYNTTCHDLLKVFYGIYEIAGFDKSNLSIVTEYGPLVDDTTLLSKFFWRDGKKNIVSTRVGVERNKKFQLTTSMNVIRLFVKTDGCTHYFEVPRKTYMSTLKTMLFGRTDVPPDFIKLSHYGRSMADDMTLEQYGIANDDTLRMGYNVTSSLAKCEKLYINGRYIDMTNISVRVKCATTVEVQY